MITLDERNISEGKLTLILFDVGKYVIMLDDKIIHESENILNTLLWFDFY